MKPICQHIHRPALWLLVFLLGMFLPGKAGDIGFPLKRYAPQISKVSQPTIYSVSSAPTNAVVIQASYQQEHQNRFHIRFEKKRKIKFLIRHLQHQPAVRKSPVRETFELDTSDDPHHEPAPDENWHTRPRYYIFLFRLYLF